jgi:delta1-piperideine-2-carboxylate reductase
MRAERDGSVSHGLFRLPAYVAGLKSKKINGKARPELENVLQVLLKY